MASYEVYLDDNNELVPEDQASQVVHTETDSAGRVVKETWTKIISPHGEAAAHIRRMEKAQQMAASSVRVERVWLVLAFVGFAVLSLLLIR